MANCYWGQFTPRYFVGSNKMSTFFNGSFFPRKIGNVINFNNPETEMSGKNICISEIQKVL